VRDLVLVTWSSYSIEAFWVGDVVYLSVLGQPIVILNSLKAVKDLLDQRSSIYSDRPIFTMVGELMGLDQVRHQLSRLIVDTDW
jgi:hypothetical protein